ncbi:hypothetical protein [Allorhizobium taibaishanense]|uniref:Preprotein translocase subunit SecY n=1 Tax=Allorhizobium taibaishanense TaxID=887144 RepID=A0A1Q8ZZI2_9HYPH|nr:hypothetical protein [Allorhizobium taibaishanense]MBB4007271.1 hypothetical protein [Allorhizobium taibaishanense]OLP47734.1 hypothetical protein BJF91_04995 [Allorhizobium taibaishanense]
MVLASDPSPSPRILESRGKGILGLVLAVVILLVGYRITLPGLDERLVSGLPSDSSTALARVSVLALGTAPVVSAFGHFEILRLIVFRFAAGRRWAAESRLFAILPIVFALVVAGMQAQGVGLAIASLGSDLGDLFVPVTVLCLVGGTALLLGFINRQARRRIDGLWLLLAASFLLVLPQKMSVYLELMLSGAFTLQTLAIALAPLVLAVALTVFTVRALAGNIAANGVRAPLQLLIWPMLLSQLVLRYIFPLLTTASPEVARIFLPGSLFGATSLILAVCSVPLVTLFTLIYARDLSSNTQDTDTPVLSSAVILMVIVLQILVLSGLNSLLPLANLPVDLDWLGLVITTAVLMVASGLATSRKP